MKVLSEDRSKWFKALSSESPRDFPVGLLEKDEHLSDALAALFALQLDGITLVFCGGSSLSKSHLIGVESQFSPITVRAERSLRWQAHAGRRPGWRLL